MGNIYDNSEFAFWLCKARKQHVPLEELYEGYQADSEDNGTESSGIMGKIGLPLRTGTCFI